MNSQMQPHATLGVVALSVVLALVPAVPTAAQTLALDTALGLSGGIVKMPFSLQTDGASIAAIDGDINFDHNVLSLIRCVINPAIATGTSTGKSLATNLLQPGIERFVLFGLGQTGIPDGLLFTCEFSVGDTTRSPGTISQAAFRRRALTEQIMEAKTLLRLLPGTIVSVGELSAADPHGSSVKMTAKPGLVVVLPDVSRPTRRHR